MSLKNIGLDEIFARNIRNAIQETLEKTKNGNNDNKLNLTNEFMF